MAIPIQEVTSKAAATGEEAATAIKGSPSIVSKQSLQLVVFDSLTYLFRSSQLRESNSPLTYAFLFLP